MKLKQIQNLKQNENPTEIIMKESPIIDQGILNGTNPNMDLSKQNKKERK